MGGIINFAVVIIMFVKVGKLSGLHLSLVILFIEIATNIY